MTNSSDLSPYLRPLGLGVWRYFPQVGSTNDLALVWAREDAPDWSLVVADAQTAGRGRGQRRWVTESGGGLAMSLVLRPSQAEVDFFTRFTALAGLGLTQALSGLGLSAQIKWPNDILIASKKIAGVLVEADWESDRVEAVVIGLGVNVTPQAVPPKESLRYPATAVEILLRTPVDRWALLAEIIRAMRHYRTILTNPAFIDAWNEHLAFCNEWVDFRPTGGEIQRVKLIGVNLEGGLIVERENGTQAVFSAGEILMADHDDGVDG
jgi:BirA family biotin operon repressor/biotin-[acetyl-CoA-carboxylase] ligase